MESLLLLVLLLSLALAVVFPLFRSIRCSASGRNRRLPPGPKPFPIIGNLLELGDGTHRSLARLADLYGPVMTLRLGQVTTIVISSEEMAKEVLQKHDAVFSFRYVPESIRVCSHDEFSMAWTAPSPRWRNLRRICNTQLFTPLRLDAHESLRREKVRELMHFVADSASKGLPVPIGRVAFTAALNLISRTVFSVDIADLYAESSQKFKRVVEGIMAEVGRPNLSDYFPLLAWIDPQGIRRRSNGFFKQLHKVFDEQIDQRSHNNKKKQEKPTAAETDFLDVMLGYQLREDSTKIDRAEMKSLFTDIFAAGSDTSSSTVEWAMTELLRSPRAMAKVREEIDRVVGRQREAEEADIDALPYLQAVVKETLRLHAPVPLLLPRRAAATVELSGGYEIPKGTQVLVNAWAIGRDSRAWKKAEEFLPERFLEEGEEKGMDFRGRDFKLIPFGAGRRICPGLPLAVRMVHLMLASLLQRFEWGLPEGLKAADIDMDERFGVTLIKAAPLNAVPVPVY